MKTYRIKTSEYKNLTEKSKVLDSDIKKQVASIEKSTSEDIKRVLVHGKNIVLCTCASGKYLIPAKPCYQASIVQVLTSVGIDNSNIVILRKSTVPAELTVAELKSILVPSAE